MPRAGSRSGSTTLCVTPAGAVSTAGPAGTAAIDSTVGVTSDGKVSGDMRTAYKVDIATKTTGPNVPPAMADMCKAEPLQWLVGKPKTEIPVPVEVVNRRVTCTTCPVTEDYSPYRR